MKEKFEPKVIKVVNLTKKDLATIAINQNIPNSSEIVLSNLSISNVDNKKLTNEIVKSNNTKNEPALIQLKAVNAAATIIQPPKSPEKMLKTVINLPKPTSPEKMLKTNGIVLKEKENNGKDKNKKDAAIDLKLNLEPTKEDVNLNLKNLRQLNKKMSLKNSVFSNNSEKLPIIEKSKSNVNLIENNSNLKKNNSLLILNKLNKGNADLKEIKEIKEIKNNNKENKDVRVNKEVKISKDINNENKIAIAKDTKDIKITKAKETGMQVMPNINITNINNNQDHTQKTPRKPHNNDTTTKQSPHSPINKPRATSRGGKIIKDKVSSNTSLIKENDNKYNQYLESIKNNNEPEINRYFTEYLIKTQNGNVANSANHISMKSKNIDINDNKFDPTLLKGEYDKRDMMYLTSDVKKSLFHNGNNGNNGSKNVNNNYSNQNQNQNQQYSSQSSNQMSNQYNQYNYNNEQFKPYNYKDYLQNSLVNSSMILGKNPSDIIGTKEWEDKQAKLKRAEEYGSIIRFINDNTMKYKKYIGQDDIEKLKEEKFKQSRYYKQVQYEVVREKNEKDPHNVHNYTPYNFYNYNPDSYQNCLKLDQALKMYSLNHGYEKEVVLAKSKSKDNLSVIKETDIQNVFEEVVQSNNNAVRERTKKLKQEIYMF